MSVSAQSLGRTIQAPPQAFNPSHANYPLFRCVKLVGVSSNDAPLPQKKPCEFMIIVLILQRSVIIIRSRTTSFGHYKNGSRCWLAWT